jgi:hypothetical protein
MRSLYSTSGGNPALRDEIGTTVELGADWRGPFEGVWPSHDRGRGHDLLRPSAHRPRTPQYRQARSGSEAGIAKSVGLFDGRVSYTFLDTETRTRSRLDSSPVPAQPRRGASAGRRLSLLSGSRGVGSEAYNGPRSMPRICHRQRFVREIFRDVLAVRQGGQPSIRPTPPSPATPRLEAFSGGFPVAEPRRAR